jgi:phosphotriesterase-related protein
MALPHGRAAGAAPGEGQAVSVLGPLDSSKLGTVLPAEFLVASFQDLCKPSDDLLRCAPLSMPMLGAVRRDPLGCESNLNLTESAEVEDELRSMRSRGAGLTTIVDLTPIGRGRDPAALREIAVRARGVCVISSTGFGPEPTTPSWLRVAPDEEIAQLMLRELTEGIDLPNAPKPKVRAGVISVSVAASPAECEWKTLRAAAIASRRSLAPVFVQMPAFEHAPATLITQVLAQLEQAGATPARVCIVVGGLTLASVAREPEPAIGAMRQGAYVCLTHCGMPDVWLPNVGPGRDQLPARLPHDGEIAALARQLLDPGLHLHTRLLLSSGVCMRLQRERYGGGGYGHLRDHLVPLLSSSHVEKGQLRDVTVHNAARLLCWWQPPPPPGRTLITWNCSWCKTQFTGPLHVHDRLPEDQMFYEKFEHRYCSIDCLAAHREAGFSKPG